MAVRIIPRGAREFNGYEIRKNYLDSIRCFPALPNQKGTISKLGADAIDAQKNGYVYVYFSNESNEMVYFDNLMLTHEKGRVLEETHYYPFGLTMAAISSKDLNSSYAENKKKFNGIDQNTD
jgi:hypothetical protein